MYIILFIRKQNVVYKKIINAGLLPPVSSVTLDAQRVKPRS